MSELKNQTLNITFSNDFNSVKSSFNLAIIPIPDDDVTTDGMGVVWIILIVFGSLVGLSLMGLFYYKTQAPKEEETLI